jgi:hypothetical protein
MRPASLQFFCLDKLLLVLLSWLLRFAAVDSRGPAYGFTTCIIGEFYMFCLS